MGKPRAITGFGPSQLTISTTGATSTGAWQRFGPFVGNTFAGQIVFTATSAGETATLQGILAANVSTAGVISAATTQGIVNLVTQTATQRNITRATSTFVFAYVRLRSTDFSDSLTAHIAAVP